VTSGELTTSWRARPQPPEAERAAALEAAIGRLRDGNPELSASVVLVRWQACVLAALVLASVIGLLLATRIAATLLAGGLIALYVIALIDRGTVVARGLGGRGDAPPARDPPVVSGPLPKYTILVPVYDEPEVIGRLVDGLGALDYPPEQLDAILLVEEDDDRTIAALDRLAVPNWLRVLLVPASEPRTKPKACNYGLEFAVGELLTIYDAEDRPDPDQLLLAVAAFAAEPQTACVQARLDFYNDRQNLLTRWFTVEYLFWFQFFLPGLAAAGRPVPLGGTSQHIRIDALRDAGGWDPFNVTEDADLGIRLARRGWKVGVIDSATYEEANSDPINWVRQRSRWYKGYLHTWLVHSRAPRQLVRELGWRGAGSVLLTIGATPMLAAINQLTWLCTIVFVLGAPAGADRLFPAPVFYAGTFCALFGNTAVVYVVLLSVRISRRYYLAPAALAYPAYWLLMATAAIKAVWQLWLRPSFWEKTAHGLTGALDEAPAGVPPA
jgi:cellulose synthase/poly-beta-1,6-N-acetylglucosamine synthase-like glycosyltransferase